MLSQPFWGVEMIVVYISLAVAVAGLLLICAGISRLRHRRDPRRLWSLLLSGCGAVCMVGALAVALLGANLQSYVRLRGDALVATISVRAQYPLPKTYSVTVRRFDGVTRATTCILQGDELGLSGRLQDWHSWTVLLGLGPTYSLDRAVSRFYHFLTPHPGVQPITACTIAPKRPMIDVFLPASLQAWLIRRALAHERSLRPARYAPLSDGMVYDVMLTVQGLKIVPRGAPQQAV